MASGTDKFIEVKKSDWHKDSVHGTLDEYRSSRFESKEKYDAFVELVSLPIYFCNRRSHPHTFARIYFSCYLYRQLSIFTNSTASINNKSLFLIT